MKKLITIACVIYCLASAVWAAERTAATFTDLLSAMPADARLAKGNKGQKEVTADGFRVSSPTYSTAIWDKKATDWLAGSECRAVKFRAKVTGINSDGITFEGPSDMFLGRKPAGNAIILKIEPAQEKALADFNAKTLTKSGERKATFFTIEGIIETSRFNYVEGDGYRMVIVVVCATIDGATLAKEATSPR